MDEICIKPLKNNNTYLEETSLKNSEACRRKSGADSSTPELQGVNRKKLSEEIEIMYQEDCMVQDNRGNKHTHE